MRDVVQIGYVALEAARLTLHRKSNELNARFSKRFLKNAEEFINNSVIDKNRLYSDIGAVCSEIEIIELSDPGIFGGLWELSEKACCGIRVRLEDILIRQEVIEILEYFDANPYTYPSKGTFAALVNNGHKLARHMNATGYPAAVIGEENASNDRVVLNGDEVRFLTPADRLYKDEQDFNINGIHLRKELL